MDRLDRLLIPEQRILDKLAVAAKSVDVAKTIEREDHGAQVFTKARAPSLIAIQSGGRGPARL